MMHAAQLRGAVPRISRTCGGAAPPAAMPRRADRIQLHLCGAALGGGSYARASHVDSTNRKILQNHVSVSIRESHGALVHLNRPRCKVQAARCYAAQPRRVHGEPALR